MQSARLCCLLTETAVRRQQPRRVSFWVSRLFYTIYVGLAIFGIGNLARLTDGLKICTVEADPVDPNGTAPEDDVLAAWVTGADAPSGSGCDVHEHCETLGPVMGATVTTAFMSTLALVVYSLVDYRASMTAGRGQCCAAGEEFTRGLLVGACAMLVLVLIQSTADYISVGKLVRKYNEGEGGDDTDGSYGTLLATGAFAFLSAVATAVDAAVRIIVGGAPPATGLDAPLFNDGLDRSMAFAPEQSATLHVPPGTYSSTAPAHAPLVAPSVEPPAPTVGPAPDDSEA